MPRRHAPSCARQDPAITWWPSSARFGCRRRRSGSTGACGRLAIAPHMRGSGARGMGCGRSPQLFVFAGSGEAFPGVESPMPPDARAIHAHNDHQREYFERTIKRTMVPRTSRYLARHVTEVIRKAELVPGDRVLEVGCGMGRYTLPLAEQGLAIEGLDLAPALLDRLREFSGGRFDIPLHAADVVNYPPALEGRFDAVIGFFALHHFHDLGACYAAMARLVRPGGRIVFLEPNPYNPSYYLQILVTPTTTWQGERGILNMRTDPMFTAMRGAGLTDASVERFGLFPPALADRAWTQPFERTAEARLG